jgi:hypothetical protein
MHVRHCLCSFSLLVAVALVVLVQGAPAWSSDALEYSGLELLDVCADTDVRSDSSCQAYFEEAMRGVDGKLWPGQRGACPPPSFDAEAALALFRSEAGIYPGVLHVPAHELIVGMLLKFFPCTGT